jgi:hypothetical protein
MQTLTAANKYPASLFSAELPTNFYKPPRRLSGGNINQKTKKMQNKPNFKNTQITTTICIARRYKNLSSRRHEKTNPIKPNSNPKQSHFSYQKPPPNPIKPNFSRVYPELFEGQIRPKPTTLRQIRKPNSPDPPKKQPAQKNRRRWDSNPRITVLQTVAKKMQLPVITKTYNKAKQALTNQLTKKIQKQVKSTP